MASRDNVITVIIPVYNAYNTLDRCVNSVLAQTFMDWELLLINDGSTDGSGGLCDEFTQKDSRIKVLHKENGGVSDARNLGIDNAAGRYIVFIDSDDYVEPTYLSSLLHSSDSELTVTSFQYHNNQLAVIKRLPYEEIFINSDNINDILMDAMYMVPWAKLFRRDIIDKHNIRFDSRIQSGEDSLFVHTYMLYVNHILASKDITYHYCITDGGLSHRICSIEETEYMLDCYASVLSAYEINHGYDLSQRYLWMIYDLFRRYIDHFCTHNKFNNSYRNLRRIVDSNRMNILLHDQIIIPKGIKRKIWDFLALHNFFILLTIYNYIYRYD